MTLEQLDAYKTDQRSIPREIARYDDRLNRLEREYRKPYIPDSMTAEYENALYELRQALTDGREKRKEEWEKQSREIKTFIDGIDDALTKAVFTARFIGGKSWWGVVEAVSEFGKYSPDSLKHRCYRFIEQTEAQAPA